MSFWRPPTVRTPVRGVVLPGSPHSGGLALLLCDFELGGPSGGGAWGRPAPRLLLPWRFGTSRSSFFLFFFGLVGLVGGFHLTRYNS